MDVCGYIFCKGLVNAGARLPSDLPNGIDRLYSPTGCSMLLTFLFCRAVEFFMLYPDDPVFLIQDKHIWLKCFRLIFIH